MPQTAKRQGYQPKPSKDGKKPPLPTTGSGVTPARRSSKRGTALAIHQPQPPRSSLEMIAQAARDPSVDVKKLEALLDLQERIEKRDQEKAFNIAMKVAQEQIPPVLKDRNNPATSSKYSTLEKVNKTIMPVILNNGFTLSFGSGAPRIPDHYLVTCVLSHISGHSRSYEADVPADVEGMKGAKNKSATQGFGSSMSYGRRYLTLMIFNIVPTDKEDNDGNTQVTEAEIILISAKQFTALNDKLENVKADKRKFCEHFRIDGLAKLPAKRFFEAIGMLDQRESGK